MSCCYKVHLIVSCLQSQVFILNAKIFFDWNHLHCVLDIIKRLAAPSCPILDLKEFTVQELKIVLHFQNWSVSLSDYRWLPAWNAQLKALFFWQEYHDSSLYCFFYDKPVVNRRQLDTLSWLINQLNIMGGGGKPQSSSSDFSRLETSLAFLHGIENSQLRNEQESDTVVVKPPLPHPGAFNWPDNTAPSGYWTPGFIGSQSFAVTWLWRCSSVGTRPETNHGETCWMSSRC